MIRTLFAAFAALTITTATAQGSTPTCMKVDDLYKTWRAKGLDVSLIAEHSFSENSPFHQYRAFTYEGHTAVFMFYVGGNGCTFLTGFTTRQGLAQLAPQQLSLYH